MKKIVTQNPIDKSKITIDVTDKVLLSIYCQQSIYENNRTIKLSKRQAIKLISELKKTINMLT